MMKKRISRLFLIMLCMLFMAGCNQKQEEKNPEKQEDIKEENPKEMKEITVYLPNDNADGFVKEKMEVESDTEEALVKILVEKGVLPKGVKANSCEKKQQDGKNVLDLDLNADFATCMQSTGTAGEEMILGSVVNTFLDTYQCDKIKITVDGGILETGHAEYTEYLERYTDQQEANQWIDFQGDQLYAVAYLGYQVRNEQQPFVEEFIKNEKPENIHISDGDMFLIIPRYPDMKIKLLKYNIDKDEKELFYESEESKPFILHCNISDIVADATIQYTYNGETVEFEPFISLKDGSIDVGEKGVLIPEAQ